MVGNLIPTSEVGGIENTGWVDMPYAISAFKRSNGEYMVFLEENHKDKVLLYRWTPVPTAVNITREVWSNVTSTVLSESLFTVPPTTTGTLTSFEAPSNAAENYVQRVRGYITAPTTGAYTFWIAGDDDVALYLSPDDQASTKVRIAFHTG